MKPSNPATVFYLLTLASLLLVRIPGIGKILRTFNTLLHESGHVFAALLLGGEVHDVKLNNDLSGSASTSSNSKLKATIISFMGYPFAAASVLLLFWLINRGFYKEGFILLISLALIHLVAFVRNTYGIVWLISIVAFLVLCLLRTPQELAIWILTCITLIVFAETIISTLQIVVLGITKPRKAGDITNLARTTHLPAWMWSFVMLAVCAWIIYKIIQNYFPPLSQLLSEFGVNINP